MVNMTYEYYKDLKGRQMALDTTITGGMDERAWDKAGTHQQREVLRVLEDRVKSLEKGVAGVRVPAVFNNTAPVGSPATPAPSNDVPTGMEDAW
jgi:tRNA splicing endonuclease